MINIQNLIRDSLKRSWNMFKMLKPWKVMCFTRNCSSLEASNSMGSELTIFLQEGAWEKTHANISSSYEPMIVHESESLEFCFFFRCFLAHPRSWWSWPWISWILLRSELGHAQKPTRLSAQCHHGGDEWRQWRVPFNRLQHRKVEAVQDQPCLWKQNCSYKIPP